MSGRWKPFFVRKSGGVHRSGGSTHGAADPAAVEHGERLRGWSIEHLKA
jgi:hypothetical protein